MTDRTVPFDGKLGCFGRQNFIFFGGKFFPEILDNKYVIK